MATFENLAGLSPERARAWGATVSDQEMLYEVVRWMATQTDTEGEGPELVEIVDQDEFTNDVVIACEDVWLVYDCS